jgi:hypothetical protein
MNIVVGQRHEIYNYQKVKEEIPKRGEIIIVRDTPDHGATYVSLIGNGSKNVQTLYREWDNLTPFNLLQKNISLEEAIRRQGDNELAQMIADEVAIRQQDGETLHHYINEIIKLIKSITGTVNGSFPLITEDGYYLVTENGDYLVTA